MDNRLKTISIIIFLFIGQVAFSQTLLREGSQNLENKTVNFAKKLSCKVTPRVVYHSKNNGYLEIYFSAEWVKKGVKLNDNKNRLFLFDNAEKSREYFKKKGFSYEYLPSAIDVKNVNFKGITITYKGKRFRHKDFNNGFVSCKKETESPLIIENINTPGAILKIEFSFVLVIAEGKDRKVKDIAQNIESWTLSIPGKSSKIVSCDDKQDEFKRMINGLSKNNIGKAKEIKAEIEKEPILEDCPDIKTALLDKIDGFLQQEKPITKKYEDHQKHF